ncbi:MAG: GldG family protein [Verrucomicrobia bacterium]|nr:GldG family protein [Verrucomicrobiota bacterium]
MAFPDSFRAARWLRTINLVLQAVLFLTFFLGLNYLARNHAQTWRKDLTQYRRFSLSPETLSYVRNLPQPVAIVVTITEDNDNLEVRGLLKEYENATATHPAGRITVRYLDPYQNRRDAEQLGIEQAGIILLKCGDRSRAVPFGELYRLKDGQRDAFIGEQVITSALLEVSNPEPQHIYFIAGHGELRPDDVDRSYGLSALKTELRLRNFKVDTLDLPAARKIPADAALLIAVAPQSRYSPQEQERLRRYLGPDAGRLMLFLVPGFSVATLGLDDLLLDWGVLVDDDMILENNPANTTAEGDLIINYFNTGHPITQALIASKQSLRLGSTRSVRPDPGRPLGSGLNTVALAATSPTAWGEINYRAAPRYDPGVDIRPIPGMEPKDRLGVAVASERVGVGGNLQLSVRGGRLVVVGSGDTIANGRITSAGHQILIQSAINWCVERDHVLNVPPRPIERYQLSLSASQLAKLRYSLLFALPGAAALLGLVVYWTRRS